MHGEEEGMVEEGMGAPAAGTAEEDGGWEAFYNRFKDDQRVRRELELDRGLREFLKSPEARDEDTAFRRLDEYSRARFGLDAERGNAWNADRKPFATASQYADALVGITRRGYEAVATDEWRAWTRASREERMRIAGVNPNKAAASDETPGAFATADAFAFQRVVPKTDAEIDAEIADYGARIEGQNFLGVMRAYDARFGFTPDERALVRAALRHGDGLPEEMAWDFERVLRADPERGRALKDLVDRTRRTERRWWRDNVVDPFVGGFERIRRGLEDAFGEFAGPMALEAQMLALVGGSADSGRWWWNDAERAEYARLKDLYAADARVRTYATADPKRLVDNMCARRLALEAVPAEERRRARRERVILEDALSHKPTVAYGYAYRTLAGVLSTLPYMAVTAVPYAGFAANVLSQFETVRDGIILDGGDEDEAVGAQLLLAAGWAGIEKAQLGHLFGKPLTGLRRKAMLAKIYKASWEGGRLAKIGAYARQGAKEAVAATLAESMEEGLQGALEAGEMEWFAGRGGGHDGVATLAAALKGGAGDFVESLGTMGVLSLVGAGVKVGRVNRDARGADSLAEYAAAALRAKNVLRGTVMDPERPGADVPEAARRAVQEVWSIWRRHAEDGTGGVAALDEIRERYGLDDAQTRDVGDWLDLRDNLVEAARHADTDEEGRFVAGVAGGMFRIGAPGSHLDAQALYDVVLPGTKVEDVEIPDPSAAPAAPVAEAAPSAELAAAVEDVSAAQAEVDAATVGSARRGAERRLRRAKKRLEGIRAKAPAPEAAPKPTRKAQKVTLPTGESYILDIDASSPDIDSEGWAQSVEQAMREAFADPALGEDEKPSVDGRGLSLDAFRALPADRKADVAVTTGQYLAMTHAERESYCENWDLGEGARTRILDETGRELLGADGVMTIKNGFRRFVHRGGNWELAHEHGHFIAAVASRHMTPGQIATMRRLFGDPTSENERWNEENANNQFAEWLRGKYDFRVFTPEERRARMNWFQRALDTIKHLFWLSGERPPAAPVEVTQRGRALDAAFNALRSGDFSGLDVYAGIDFAEDHAGKDGKDAAPDARRPASTASVEKAGNPAPEAGKSVQAASRPVSEAPATKPAAKPDAKRPEGGGAPTASADFQAGYDAAVAAMNANPGAFADGQSVRTGGKMTVVTPDYSMKVEAEPMWTPLAALVESTDDREVQMRDRTRAATDEQTHSKTRPGVFQPLALFPGSKSDDGAPIVGGGNRIISGHGRKRMLDILAQEGRFGEYLDAVAAEAARRGLTPPPDGMENPVLVLRVTGGLDRRADLVRFAELSNRWGGLERSGAEFAESDARHSVRANPRLRREYDEVVARYTNPDGTKRPGWMRAPNGKPTRLTERQWVQVRTPSFKKWFGDWERGAVADAILGDADIASDGALLKMEAKAQRAEAKRIYDALKAGGPVETADGRSVHFLTRGFKEIKSHSADPHTLAIVPILKEVVASARYIGEGDVAATAANKDVKAYHIYARRVNLGDGSMVARIVIREDKNGNQFYDEESTSIENVKEIQGQGSREPNTGSGPESPYAPHSLAEFFGGINPDSVSKVVDENGEPLVVYHGSPHEFSVFDRRRIRNNTRNMRGFFFTTNRDTSGYYGKEMPCFLNVRRPLVETRGEGGEETIQAALKDGSIARHDGTIAYAGEDIKSNPYLNRGLAEDGIIEIVVPNPTQIKSATDNTGAFDPANPDIRFSVGRLYTGSAADYEKPSLHAVGTGEGSQVYGWGLYASDRRGVAEGYANSVSKRRASTPDEMWPKYKGKFDSELEHDPVRTFALKYVAREGSVDAAIQFLRTDDWTERAAPKAREAAEWLEKNRDDVTPPQTPSEHLYEQTWFTDRAPGDESHLLKWYEPVSEEQGEWILDALKDMGSNESLLDFVNGERKKDIERDGLTWRDVEGEDAAPDYYPDDVLRDYLEQYLDLAATGGEVYGQLSEALGSPKAASEFLARAGIDGVKYQADSYGKAVKDGDEAGWNYVSFRDDNIRVDHKWTDGEMRFSVRRVTPEEDAAYMDAVRRGDMEASEKMERDAVARAMPNTKVVGADGKPMKVYHGSRTGANIKIFRTPSFFSDNRDVADMFKKEADFILRVNGKEVAIDDVTARQIADELTRGDYTPDEMADWGSFAEFIRDIEDNGKGYGGRDVIADALGGVGIDTPLDEITEMSFMRVPDIYECYVNITNPLEIDFKGKTWGQEGTKEMESSVRDAAKNGYDGVIVRNIREGGFLGELRNGEEPPLSTDYIPVSPNQIKLADAVTRDDAGNVIPLSQRFDQESPDIRFSVRLAPELRETLTLEPSDEATAKASVKAWRAERKAFTNRRNGRTAELKADWTKIFSEPAKKKSANYAAHYAAANRLDTLFEDGVRMWDESPRNGSRDIRAYAKYGCPFEFGGETYLAKITVKEYADGKSTDGFYSIEAISVEKISAGGINAGITSIEGHELDPGATAVLKNMLQQTPRIIPNAAAERNVRSSVQMGSRDEQYRYGIGSSLLNGEGFVDLEKGDTYRAIEEAVRTEVGKEVTNETLGITAKIGSNANANHIVSKMSAFGDEDSEAHKYAAKNILSLFEKAAIGIVHHDKKGTPNDYIRAFAPFHFAGRVELATITLRRDKGGNRLYTVEAVETGTGSSPRSSWRTTQGAQLPVSLDDRIAYYVGDVNRTQPAFIGRDAGIPFTPESLKLKIDIELEKLETLDKTNANRQPQEVEPRQIIVDGHGRMTDANGRPVARSSATRRRSVGLANVATALFAQQLLAGKEVSARSAYRLLRNIGLGALPAPALLARAKELAEKNREKVQRLVRDNAPELVAALAQSGLEAQFRDAIDGAVTGTAKAVDPSVGREVQRAVQRHKTRELMAARGFDAAQMMAELPIDLPRCILATADRVKTPEERAKLEEARKRREEERAAAEAEMTDEERLAAVDDPTYVPPSEESLALFRQLYDSAAAALEARQAEERRDAAEKAKRQAEGQQDGSGEADAAAGSVPSAQADADEFLPAETVQRIAPVFDSPELFAQFLVEWTAKHVVERHPNIRSKAKMWKNPVAIRELKQTATGILRKLARDCLGSPSLNYARNFVDHQINELESDAETRTYKSVLRKVAYVYDAIHENALRLKRRELVNRLVNGYRAKNPETGKTETVPGIRQLAGVKGRFSAVKEEFQRAIDARTEVWARQLVPLLTMGEERLASEIAEMERRLAADPTADDYVPMDDDARREMADRLALARKYGGLVRRMPGEIADAADEILSDLNGKRQAFEQRRLERENEDKAARDAIVNAMRAGSATDFRKPQGRLGRYADAMQGNLTLEMQNLVRFCQDPELRRAALEAIETLQAWISEATGRYRVVLGEALRELREGLAACYGSAEEGIRHLLKDELDPETAAKIFKSRDKVPTYGQLLQLYASSIQSDYRENAEKHGRTAALPIMEQTLTDADKAFHAFAVEWYKRNRRALSDAVEAVTGLPVTSPDALYCPVRVQTEADGFSADAVAWSPVPAALNRRVRHGLDFNEGVNFLSVLQEQAEIRAQTIGYSAVGIRLRDILAHRETQKAARETVGKRDIKTVLDHVKDVLVQNAARKDESAFFAPLNLARKWIAHFALAGNVPNAIKQLASMPVWANAMLGGHEIGLRRTMHYLATVGTDEGRAAIRDLAESDGFKARYTMGWSEETQNILMNPSKSRILRYVEKAYDKGMIVNKAVDAISCLWMAQGFYRDARAHFLSKGLASDEAKRMALAMTWSVCESGQQSGRIENMNSLQRKGGAGVAAIFQFKTAYLLQNAYLLQAIKEWRAGTPGAMGRAIRAAFINCVWIPAFVQCVNLAWSALMGDEPPEEDPEKWPKWLKDFGWSMIDGVTAPMFGVSTAAHTAYDAVTGNWSWSQSSGIPAIDSAIRVTGDAVRAAADLFKTVTCLDAEEELTSEKLQKDVWRLLKDIAAPVRHGKRAYDNRWGEGAR